MAHIPVRHPAGDLRSSKSAILPICHRQTGGVGAAAARPPDPLPRCLYYGHPALRPPGQPSAVQIRSRRICAPNATWRAQLTPSGRGKRPPTDEASTVANSDDRSPIERRRAMTLSTAPQARVTPGILPSALRASLSAVPNRSRRFGQHRREHVRPLWRHATDRGQHRRTHRHPRHPRPLRKARRAGESALPPRPARTAGCGRVTPRRPRRRRRNQ